MQRVTVILNNGVKKEIVFPKYDEALHEVCSCGKKVGDVWIYHNLMDYDDEAVCIHEFYARVIGFYGSMEEHNFIKLWEVISPVEVLSKLVIVVYERECVEEE